MLRDYQQELYDRTRSAFARGRRRVLVVAPCGAGKSYIFLEMARACMGQVLVLTHRKELGRQHRQLVREMGLTNVRVEMVTTEYHRMTEHATPKLLIVDEAHLSYSSTWASVVNYYDTYTVGFTATPVRLDGRPLGDIYEELVQGVGVRELIEEQYLAPVRYFVPLTVDVSRARISRGDFSVPDLEYIMGNRAIYGNIINSVKYICREKQCIAYCVSIRHAELTAAKFTDAGISAEVISSQMADSLREKLMGEFLEGKFQILCNVGIISEGISLENVSCCLLLRPTLSHALYWQQAMRCMRYAPYKKAYILDFVGNYTRNPLPDEDVVWELNRVPKKTPLLTGEGDFRVRVCPGCYRTFPTADTCPYCGKVYPLSPREIQAHEEIRLAELEEEEKLRLQEEKKRLRMEVGRARTYPELLRLARQRGYDPAWARMVWNGRRRNT